MGLRVIAYRTSIFGLLREILYSLAQINQEPLAAIYLPSFQALHDEWKTVLLEEIAIYKELANAQAAVDQADHGLDAFVTRVSNAVNEHTDGHTRKQIRQALFKNKALSKFKRPVLGGQLSAMIDWSETLKQCGVPALATMAPEAETLTAAGENAQELRDAAQKKNRDFRDVGMRKQFIDKLNATRREAHGGLGKLSFENPKLSRDFAEIFFYSEAPRDEEESIDEVKDSIQELEARLEERRGHLKKLEDEAALMAQAAAERKALESSAQDLEAQAQALLAQAALLKAKLKK